MEPLVELLLTARMSQVDQGCLYVRLHLRREVWRLLCVEEAHRRGLVRTPGVMRRREVSTGEVSTGEHCRLQLAVVLQANSRQIGSRQIGSRWELCGYSGSVSSAPA